MMMKLDSVKLIGLVLLSAAFFMFSVSDANAQKIKQLFDKKMPQYDAISDADFANLTFEQTDVPFNDRFLAYKINLPNDWTPPAGVGVANYNLSANLMGDVALFFSPPRVDAPRSKFELKALKLEFEITAEQWLLKHVLSNGYTLEGLEYFNKDKVGALYIYVEEGETFVVRSVAQINGKRMILARYVVPAQYWMQEAPLIARSLHSYELLNPERLQIENMQDYLFLDIAQFQYPESWNFVAPPVRMIDRMEVDLNNIRKGSKGILDGQIKVEMVSSFIVEDLEQELDDLKTRLRKKGLLVGELIESRENIEFADDVEFGFVDVFEGTDTENNVLNYEIWNGVFALDNYFIFTTLVTPHRDHEFFTWSRNVTTYQNVLRSTQLQEKSLMLE